MATPDDVLRARLRAGLSQVRLAARLGVNDKTLREFEKGVPRRLQDRDKQALLDAFVAEHTPDEPPPDPGVTAQAAQLRGAADDLDLMAALAARIAAQLRAAAAGHDTRGSEYTRGSE